MASHNREKEKITGPGLTGKAVIQLARPTQWMQDCSRLESCPRPAIITLYERMKNDTCSEGL